MSRDVYADAARKYAHTLPGHILLAAEPAAIPASTLTLDVLVEQTEELEASQKYALRAMLNGLDSIEDLQLFLGLDDRDILRAIAGLLDAEYIDYRPPPEGALRRLTLTDAGRDAARDAQLRRPAPATVPVVYDRLTRTVTPWNKRALTRTHVAKSNAARILLPPASAMPVGLHDLNVDALTAALDIRREPIHILGISGVTENPVYYYGAILLIYKNFDTNELRLGVDVDGTWSEPHAAVLEKIGAVDRLRITAAPADEVHESVTDSADRLGRDEVIALQTALDSNETGPDGNQLDRAQIRWLGVYEHPTWLNDAVSSSQHRLLIISPRITGSVVDQRWVDRVEKLAQTADVTIFWGHGDNTNTDETAVDRLHNAARRSSRLAIVRVPSTVAKVLVSDGYYIKTNFNWLSFRGTPSRQFRHEEGDLVQNQELADHAYDKYMSENCTLALEVVGTLPAKYRTSIKSNASTPSDLQPASQPAPLTARTDSPATMGSPPADATQSQAPTARRRERRKKAPASNRETARRQALSKITVGESMSGVVKNLENYGAFVSLGDNLDGLIHISKLGRQVHHPSAVVQLGQTVVVIVEDVDIDRERVSLKLKSVDGRPQSPQKPYHA
jgi:hypothetical protein